MQSLLVFNSDDRPFAVEPVAHILQSENGFRDMRFNEPGGAAIEAVYDQIDDYTIVRLTGDRETISLSGTTDAALRAVLILQRRLPGPLRIIDTDYSFDLALGGFASIEELRAAINSAHAG